MISEAVRVLIIILISFTVAFGATPFALRLIIKLNLRKQIRASDDSPIFSKLHASKSGTPTMGGVIIWGTVLGLALLFWGLDVLFDGLFGYLNFIDRGQTFLPFTALVIASLLGLFDDILGVLKIGSKGGGLTFSRNLIVYTLFSSV